MESVNLTFIVDAGFTGTSLVNVTEITSDDGNDVDSTPGNDDGDQGEDDEDSAEVILLPCTNYKPVIYRPGEIPVDSSGVDCTDSDIRNSTGGYDGSGVYVESYQVLGCTDVGGISCVWGNAGGADISTSYWVSQLGQNCTVGAPPSLLNVLFPATDNFGLPAIDETVWTETSGMTTSSTLTCNNIEDEVGGGDAWDACHEPDDGIEMTKSGVTIALPCGEDMEFQIRTSGISYMAGYYSFDKVNWTFATECANTGTFDFVVDVPPCECGIEGAKEKEIHFMLYNVDPSAVGGTWIRWGYINGNWTANPSFFIPQDCLKPLEFTELETVLDCNSTSADICAYVAANPTSALATMDCDGGGIDNLSECQNGDDPTDASDDVTGPLMSDLRLIKNIVGDEATVGDNVNLSLRVTNLGPDDDTNIVVTDVLPAGMTFVSSTCATESGGVITWNLGALANGGDVSCISVVEITETGDITNTGTVTGDNQDPNMNNNNSSDMITGLCSDCPASCAAVGSYYLGYDNHAFDAQQTTGNPIGGTFPIGIVGFEDCMLPQPTPATLTATSQPFCIGGITKANLINASNWNVANLGNCGYTGITQRGDDNAQLCEVVINAGLSSETVHAVSVPLNHSGPLTTTLINDALISTGILPACMVATITSTAAISTGGSACVDWVGSNATYVVDCECQVSNNLPETITLKVCQDSGDYANYLLKTL